MRVAQQAAREIDKVVSEGAKVAERVEREKTKSAERSGRERVSAEQRAAREVQRINEQTRRQAEQQDRLRERAAKNLADVQVREARRAASELARSLNPQGSQRGGGSSFGQMVGAAGLGFGAAGVIASLVNEFKQGAGAVLAFSGRLEQASIGFETLTGSATESQRHLKELQDFANRTPFQFEELLGASRRMHALGIATRDIIPILNDAGNAVSALGGSGETLDRVILALSQMQAKGRVMTQELNQLAEAGIPGWKILEQQFGKSRAELVKMVEQGEVSSQTFLEAFHRFSQVNFGGAMEKQSRTFLGALSTIEDALLLASARSFNPLFERISEISIRFADEIKGADGMLDVMESASGAAEAAGAKFAGAIIDGIISELSGFDITSFLLRHAADIPTAGARAGLRAGISRANPNVPTGTDVPAPPGTPGSLLDLLPHVPPPAVASMADAKKWEQAINQAAQAAIRQAEVQLRAAERLHKDATAAAEREYELRQISLDEFIRRQIAAEERLAAAKAAALAKEKGAAGGLTDDNARTTKIAELAERESVAEAEKNRRIQALRDRQFQEERETARKHAQALLEIQEEADKRQIELWELRAEQNIVTFEYAEERRKELLLKGLNDRIALLAKEEEANANNVEEFQKINDQIALLHEQKATAEEEANQRIADARRRDLESLREWARRTREIEEGTLDLAFEIGERRIALLERAGADPRSVRAERARFDTERAEAEHARRLADIADERARLLAATVEDNERRRAEITALFHEREMVENERHSLELQEILSRPYLHFMGQVRRYADEIGDVVGGAFDSLFEKGRSFWGLMGEGFRRMFQQIVRDFIGSGVSRFIQSLFNPAMAAQGGAGGGFSFGSILGGLFGRGGGFLTGGFGGGNPAGAILSGGPNLSPLVSASTGTVGGLFGGGGMGSSAVGALGRAGGFGGFSLAGAGGLAAPLLPLLGASLGGRFGGALGGIGGLLLGGAGAVGLLGALGGGAAASGGAIGAAAGGAVGGGGLFGTAAAFLTNPFTIAAGAALLIGGFALQRNRARRQAETQRGALSHDTGTAIWQLIGQAQRGNLGVREARQQFDQIMARYDQGVAQIRESKTRGIAIATRRHFEDLWPILEANAREHTDAARARAANFRETYSVPTLDFAGMTSGLSGGAASPFSAPSIPAFTPPVPSFSPPAIATPAFAAPGASGGNPAPTFVVQNQILLDDQGVLRLVTNVLRSPEGRREIIETSESRVKLSALRAPVG